MGFIRNNPAYEVFLSTRLGVTQVLPPHAVNSYGAVLDDAGRIGGIFADPSGDLHGFSFFSGRYSVFDMPSKPTAIYLGGIGGNGNIVGIFTTQTTRNAFLYSGGKLEIIGTWALADNARIMISPHGNVIAISIQMGGQGHFESFFGACN